MAQGKGKAGARLDLQLLLHGRAVPEAAASPDGGVTGAPNLVLLYKPLPYRPGYYAPFAVVQLQDLPGQLQRQITGGGFYAQAAAPLSDEGAERHLLQVLRAGVPEGAWMQQFGGGAPSIRRGADAEMGAFGDNGLHAPLLHKKNPADAEMGGNGAPAPENAEHVVALLLHKKQISADGEVGASDGDGVPARDNAERFAALLLHKKNPADGDMDAFDGNGVPARDNAERFAALLLHKKNPADGDMDAFDGNGVPARENAALLLHKNNPADGETGAFYITALPAPEFPGEDDAVPLLLVPNRSAEQGSLYHYNSGVLVPSPENVMPGWEATRSPTYAVQVWVDAAAGAKAGDPIAVDVKADAGEEEEAGNERGSLSAVVGIVAASSAATALAAGAVGPVAAFGLFAVLVGGLSLAMASVRAA